MHLMLIKLLVEDWTVKYTCGTLQHSLISLPPITPSPVSFCAIIFLTLNVYDDFITASSLLGHKSSIYSVATNASGSLVISGSTEKVNNITLRTYLIGVDYCSP